MEEVVLELLVIKAQESFGLLSPHGCSPTTDVTPSPPWIFPPVAPDC